MQVVKTLPLAPHRVRVDSPRFQIYLRLPAHDPVAVGHGLEVRVLYLFPCFVVLVFLDEMSLAFPVLIPPFKLNSYLAFIKFKLQTVQSPPPP